MKNQNYKHSKKILQKVFQQNVGTDAPMPDSLNCAPGSEVLSAENDKQLRDLMNSNKSFIIEPADKNDLEHTEKEVEKNLKYINENTDKQMEDYMLIAMMSKIYFGPKTAKAFNDVDKSIAKKNDEHILDFHDGAGLAPCMAAMMEELNYGLK